MIEGKKQENLEGDCILVLVAVGVCAFGAVLIIFVAINFLGGFFKFRSEVI